MLISRYDRKARIELGADWGRRWDAHAAGIMENRIISRFKKDDYAGGIVAGVEALMKMAEQGPDAEPPSSIGDFLPESLDDLNVPTSMFSGNIMGIMVLVGIGCIVLAIFLPDYRKWLLIGGFGLIATALLTWVVLVIAGAFLRGKGDRGGGGFGGGFSSGGGFGTGGFSGGGGASGSW